MSSDVTPAFLEEITEDETMDPTKENNVLPVPEDLKPLFFDTEQEALQHAIFFEMMRDPVQNKVICSAAVFKCLDIVINKFSINQTLKTMNQRILDLQENQMTLKKEVSDLLHKISMGLAEATQC